MNIKSESIYPTGYNLTENFALPKKLYKSKTTK